jgi:hypothetical protein
MDSFRAACGFPAGTSACTVSFLCVAVLTRARERDVLTSLHCPRVLHRLFLARAAVARLQGAALAGLVSACVRQSAVGMGEWWRASSAVDSWRVLAVSAPGSLRERVSGGELLLSGCVCLRCENWADCLRAVLGRVPESFMRRIEGLSRASWDSSDARCVLHALRDTCEVAV